MANILYVRLTEAQSEDLKRRAEEERISVAAVARRALWPPKKAAAESPKVSP